MTRLFIAVWPPAEVVTQLEALPRADAPGVRWVAPDQWHVTLRFLGSTEVADVVARMGTVALPPATARLGPVVSRLGRATVVVPVAGLDELARVVSSATADIGESPDPRPFTGHLTLARLRHRAACGVAGARIDSAFDVSEVVLVDSRTDSDGAHYTVVARLPVGVPPA